MKYKVSIIVPVYKAERYLCQCVEALLAQTLDSVEIILVEDGSPDRCGQLCDDYAAQYANIVALHLENGGPSKARNRGLEAAHGKYVGFVDADDYVQPEMYEKLYCEAEEKQANIVMCGYYIDDGKKKQRLQMKYKHEYCGREDILNGLSALYYTRYNNGLFSVCNKLFNNSLLQKEKIKFDEELIRAEDAWFVFDCLKVADRVCFLDEALYNYRMVPTSTMHTVQEDRYERSKAFRVKLSQESESLGIKIDKNEFFYGFLYEAVIYCRTMVQKGDLEKAEIVLRDPFFQKACRFTKYLPIHIKMICLLERIRCISGAKLLLRMWSANKDDYS